MPHSCNTDWHCIYDNVVQIWEGTEQCFAGAAAMVSVPQDMPMQALPSCTGRTLWEAPWQQAILEGQQRWCLPDIVDRMFAAYCGTLTAEIDHLASQ